MLTLQLALNALALGSAYALVTLGFVLVINATGAVNFAHGDLVMAGGFLAVLLGAALPVPGFLLLPLVLAIMAAAGLAVAAIGYFPVRRGPVFAPYIATIAIGIMLQNAATNLFGAAPRRGPPLVDAAPVTLADGLSLPPQALAVIGVTALLLLGQHLLFRHTQLGRRLRATAQDAEMAEAIGIDTRWTIAGSFALAAALAGAAGLLLAPQFFVTPQEGGHLILKAYIATVIGGWGSLRGALLGALLIAAAEVLVASLVSQPAAEACLYGGLLLLLWLRPQGLFGEAAGRRA